MLRDTAGEEDNSFLYFSFFGSPDEQGERLRFDFVAVTVAVY